MKKFIALNETGAVKMRQCNKAACEGCRHKNERPQAVVAKEADNKVNILQLYYAALIQCHISQALHGNQDAAYLHCT